MTCPPGRVLAKDRLAKSLYEHPLVYGLFKGEYDPKKSVRNLPSYIPSKNFALALIDIVARGPSVPVDPTGTQAAPPSTATTPLSLDSLRVAVGEVQNAPVQRALLTAVDTAQGDLGRA